jgi:hypothetical protein
LNAGTKNIGLLTELREALAHNSWLWILREFRNQMMQKPSKEVQDFLLEDRSTSTSSIDQNKSTGNYDEYINNNLVDYFERNLGRVRELIDIIRMKESLLK